MFTTVNILAAALITMIGVVGDGGWSCWLLFTLYDGLFVDLVVWVDDHVQLMDVLT